MQRLIKFWYQDKNPFSYVFYPLHWLLVILIRFRKFLYQNNILKSVKVKAPVIIVGNITVGGTGKSPLVIHLAQRLSEAGYRVGVLSRGYGGQSNNFPLEVHRETTTSEAGDEPVMIKQRLDVKVVIDPQRGRGASYLVDELACDLIICDDGLQHYALQRDIELLVVDEQRKFGNGLVLPFGPLREPVSRVQEVDAVIVNQSEQPVVNKNIVDKISLDNQKNNFIMTLKSISFININQSQNSINPEEFLMSCLQQNTELHAVAAIGNPKRFFNHLTQLGFKLTEHEFNDHHSFISGDFDFINGIIIMTEKDAVKCHPFATDNMWYLKVNADISPSISQYCVDLLKK